MLTAVSVSDLPASQLYVDLAERHGHYCPMSTLGLRLGWAALQKLESGLRGATYFTQTCARDGIRLSLHFEELQVEEQGQHLLRFGDRTNQWEIELLPKTLELAASYRLLNCDTARDSLLEGFRTAEESILMKIVQTGGAL